MCFAIWEKLAEMEMASAKLRRKAWSGSLALMLILIEAGSNNPKTGAMKYIYIILDGTT